MRLAFPLSLLLLSTLSCQLLNPDPGKGRWFAVVAADGSTYGKRHDTAFIECNGKLYLLGGRDLPPVSVFDPVAGRWTNGSVPPVELNHFQPVVLNSLIYIIGAMNGPFPDEAPVPFVYTYDPAKDVWAKGDSIPADRLRGSTGNVVVDGVIYIAGGIRDGHNGDHKRWLDAYDPATGVWTVLPDAPRARDHFHAVAAEGKIYLAGGRRTAMADGVFNNTVAEVDVYDIASGAWSTAPHDLPTPRAGTAAVRYGDAILVAGGESMSQKKAHRELEALSLSTLEWRRLARLPVGRHGSGLAALRDTLYFASGCSHRGGEPLLETMDAFTITTPTKSTNHAQ